jgi:hypothetical protein
LTGGSGSKFSQPTTSEEAMFADVRIIKIERTCRKSDSKPSCRKPLQQAMAAAERLTVRRH